MSKKESERGSNRHSEYLEGIDYVRLQDLAEAMERWNRGDRGNCGCPTCSGKIRNNLINDGNRLLNNLGEDIYLSYNPKDRKIYWIRKPEEGEEGEAA